MKNLKTILGVTIIASLVIIGCGENSNNTKELEQQNGELTKEKSLQEKDTNNLGAISNESPEKEAGQENIKSPSETKTLTMIFEDYSEGDFPHLLFTDVKKLPFGSIILNKNNPYELYSKSKIVLMDL